MLLVQLLVLVFTGVLWWIARRDLAAHVPPPVPPTLPSQATDMAELEQLCATLETLATSLARRLDAVEAALNQTSPNQAVREEAPWTQFPSLSPAAVQEPPREPPKPVQEESPAPQPDPRYSPIYALLDRGVSDPIEIARLTGLGRGEVDLILSLRGRRAL